MHMKVHSNTTLSFPTLSLLLTAGKNIVGYFLDRVVFKRELSELKGVANQKRERERERVFVENSPN
jgi:hypothetical protein